MRTDPNAVKEAQKLARQRVKEKRHKESIEQASVNSSQSMGVNINTYNSEVEPEVSPIKRVKMIMDESQEDHQDTPIPTQGKGDSVEKSGFQMQPEEIKMSQENIKAEDEESRRSTEKQTAEKSNPTSEKKPEEEESMDDRYKLPIDPDEKDDYDLHQEFDEPSRDSKAEEAEVEPPRNSLDDEPCEGAFEEYEESLDRAPESEEKK